MKVTIEQIKKAYSEEKRLADRSEWFAFYLIRPLSFFLTVHFIRREISANSVTWISIFIVFLGLFLIGFGGFYFRVTGSLFLLVWLVLDHVDGNIARFTGSQSNYGDFLDTVAGYLVLGTFPLFLGLAAFFDHTEGDFAWLFLFLGAVASVANIYPRLFYQKFLNYRSDKQEYKSMFSGSSQATGSSFKSKLFLLINNVLNPSGLLLVLVLVVIVLQKIDWFLIWYCATNVFISAYSLIKFCRVLKNQQLTVNR